MSAASGRDKTIIRTTCPRDCYDACGIVVIKRDGRITKVLGDPDHPVSSLHSDRFAPVMEPTLKTGVMAMSLAVLDLVGVDSSMPLTKVAPVPSVRTVDQGRLTTRVSAGRKE